MKRLLFSSIGLTILVLCFACSNKNNKVIKNSKEIVDTTLTKVLIDSVAIIDSDVVSGDTLNPTSSDTKGSTKGTIKNEMEIKHNEPDQERYDSIKRAKTKGKK